MFKPWGRARIRPLFGLNLLRPSSHIWANGEKGSLQGQPVRAAGSHPARTLAGTLLAPCWHPAGCKIVQYYV